MRNSKHYVIDDERQEADAWLEEGALLYRIASQQHWQRDFIVAGDGPMHARTPGRFHGADQRASYCANNIFLCFAEMLYHMYRNFLTQLSQFQPEAHAREWTVKKLRLVIFTVKRIDALVYVDSIGVKSYDPTITSSTVVFPDPIYGPLHNVSERARQAKKNGVVYPSARHSKDLAFVFFRNETPNVLETPYKALDITLQLISEEQDTLSFPPSRFKVYTDKLHATMGYYQFDDPAQLDALKKEGFIYPEDLPLSGYVDFVRRHYEDYPKCAVRP